MNKQPGSGDPSFQNSLEKFYVKENMPSILEYGNAVMKDITSISEVLLEHIQALEDGIYEAKFPQDADCIEIQSLFTSKTYRFETYYINGHWMMDSNGLNSSYLLFYDKYASLARKRGMKSMNDCIREAFESQSQYARFFSRLAAQHPMIGIMNLLFLSYAKDQKRECLSWYEPAIKHAQSIMLTLDAIEEAIQENTTNEHVRHFVTDVRKEFELLIIDAMNILFFHAKNQDMIHPKSPQLDGLSFKPEDGYKSDQTARSFFEFDIQGETQKKSYLDKMRKFYKDHEEDFEFASIKGIGDIVQVTEKFAEYGTIDIPFYFKGSDITKLLRFFETHFKAIKHVLDGKSQIMPDRMGGYEVRFRNGVTALFRGIEDTKKSDEINKAQARISFGYEGVKLRLDRDEERGRVMLDFGEIHFNDALFVMDTLLTGRRYDPNLEMSLMDSRFQRLIESHDPARKAEIREIHMRTKIALIVSGIMRLTEVSLPHRQEYFSSYHSSDHIGKKEYFEHFPEIAEELEKIFMGRKE